MLQVFEYDHTMRRIYTDGRPLVHGSGSNWMEYSVGIGKAITASLSIPWIQRELFRAKFAVVEQGSINIVREIRNETRGRSANEDTTRGQ